mmetsp:Transcript_47778/g.138104  ORF Transcript_47778/g.138104 Transcript_47778/m.138104 type:complete len:363 (-) Transcript_47778:358-1446(-)
MQPSTPRTPSPRAAAAAVAAKSAARQLGDPLQVQIASDLHLEFYDELPRFQKILVPSAPVLALLGDISALGHARGCQLYEQFLQECCEHFERVLLLVGNHEFYSHEELTRSSDEILRYIRELCKANPKLQLLENEGVTINSVRVIGTALWSAVPEIQTVQGARSKGRSAQGVVEVAMNDYHCIFVSSENTADAAKQTGGSNSLFNLKFPSVPCFSSGKSHDAAGSRPGHLRKALVADTNFWHRQAVEFIEREAREATSNEMNLLVLTHHTPSFEGTSDPRHGADPFGLSSAFSSDLHYVLQDPAMSAIRVWCFGHTHYNSDQMKHGVRLLSNQHGYVEQMARGYRRDLVVEVSSQWQVVPAA